MSKRDKTFTINFLLSIIGFILILGGIIWALLDRKNELYVVLTTVGGTIFGSSFTWIIEDYFRKKDERLSAYDLFNQAIDIFERALRNEDLPREKDIKIFRENILHIYYSTKSETEEFYWSYIQLNFKNCNVLNKLLTETNVYNINGTRMDPYIVEITRRYFNDPVVIKFRRKDSKDSIAISVFEACYTINNISYGFTAHEDWSDKWRLSPSILSFKPLILDITPGSIPKVDGKKLESQWNQKFYKDKKKSFFEKYNN